jgi:hypothetical protein
MSLKFDSPVYKRKRIIIEGDMDEDEETAAEKPVISETKDENLGNISVVSEAAIEVVEEVKSSNDSLCFIKTNIVVSRVLRRLTSTAIANWLACFVNNDCAEGQLISDNTKSFDDWEVLCSSSNFTFYKRFGDHNTWNFVRRTPVFSTITYLFDFKSEDKQSNAVMLTINTKKDQIQQVYPAFLTDIEEAAFMLKQLILIAVADAFNSSSGEILFYVDETAPSMRGRLKLFATKHLKFFRPRGGSSHCIFLKDLLAQSFDVN